MKRLHFIAILPFIVSAAAQADCRSQHIKGKAEAPSIAYQQEVAVSTCEINEVKPILMGEKFHTLCPGAETPYRQRCLRDWIKARQINTSVEPSLILNIIHAAAVEDKEINYVNPQLVLVQLVDAVLLTFERTDYNYFYVHRLVSDHPELKAEIDKAKKTEVDALKALQAKILPNMEEKIRTLKTKSVREPASDSTTRQWINTMVSKLEGRLQLARAKRFEAQK